MGKINEKASNWQGGKTEENKKLRGRIEIKNWRWEVFKRDNFTCQHCGKTQTYLHAHHIKEFVNYPKLRDIVTNGITLCIHCHKIEHKKIGMPRRRIA